jgi:tripartite-type tricarboxylate transporter receptor subunit TctC
VTSFASPANAQSPEDFYRRTPVNLLVGSGAGGGFDQYARIFAQHFGKHVPGNPNVIIRNMPGAAGLVAMNHLYNNAPRDGSTILASFNTIVMHQLYGDPNAKFDPRRLGWLGSTGKLTGACLSWHASNLRTLEDAKNRESLMGSTGDSSTPVMYPKLLNTFIGTKFKVITGYSTPGLRMAVEQGEVEGICGIAYETHMASVPSWIIDRKVNFIAQLGLTESAHMKGVPLALDHIQKADERQIFELLGIPQEFGRPYFGPPGVPADRLAVLQSAFEATIRDGAYLADAERAKQFVDPLSAREIEALIARAYAAPPDVVKRASAYAMTEN